LITRRRINMENNVATGYINNRNLFGYGNFVVINETETIEKVEEQYASAWSQAKEFCKRAGKDIAEVSMIVKLTKCETARDKELGIHTPSDYQPPAMTIGWKVLINAEQDARLTLDDIRDLCHDTFFMIAQANRNAMKADK
jgi:hypothetical protein